MKYSTAVTYYKGYENKIPNRNWNISSKCFSIIPEVCKERIEILLVFTTVLTSSAFISMLPIIHLGF